MRYDLSEHRATGLSGLAFDPHGRLWAVSERDRVLLRLERRLAPEAEDQWFVAERVSVSGVPEGLDVESLVWLGPRHLVVGTEGRGRRAKDALLFLDVGPDEGPEPGLSARVTDVLDISYDAWNLAADDNHGLEALCYRAPYLYAAVEMAQRNAFHGRVAPLVVVDTRSRKMHHLWLGLQTHKGKIAGMTCRANASGGTRMWIIERHFGVAHLLRAEAGLPQTDGQKVRTQVALDLAQTIRAPDAWHRTDVLNFEGLAIETGPELRAHEARNAPVIYAVTDNHYGRVTGPSTVFEIQLKAPKRPEGPKPNQEGQAPP